MDKQYQENMYKLKRLLRQLADADYELDVIREAVEEGLTKIQECIDLLDKPKGDLRTVSMRSGKLSYEPFNDRL